MHEFTPVASSPELTTPPIIEYLLPDEVRYPLRMASVDDFEAICALNEQSCQPYGRDPWWPNKIAKKAAIWDSIVAKTTYVVEDDDGNLAASTVVKEEGDPMLWGNDNEPSLYISRLMKRPGIEDAALGAELLCWVGYKANIEGKVYVRLDVRDDEDEPNARLRAYYSRQGFQQLRSKVWAEYPSSALFEFNVGTMHNPDTLGSRRISTPADLANAPEPFSLLDSLNPFDLAAWRRSYYKDAEQLEGDHVALMGSLINGTLSAPQTEKLFYRSDGSMITNAGFTGNPHQTGNAASEATYSAMLVAARKARIVRRPVVEDTNLRFDLMFDDISDGPVSIHDMLDTRVKTALFRAIGPARFLVYTDLAPSRDTTKVRGKRYLRAIDGALYEWQVVFNAVERPATNRLDCTRAWQFFRAGRYNGPGILAEGTFDGKQLALDGMRIALLSPDQATEAAAFQAPDLHVAPGQAEHSHAAINGTFAAPGPGQLGPQPYVPQPGDRMIARLGISPPDLDKPPHIRATLYKVERPSTSAR